ncbi:MAG TPA: hypothetical protein VGZ73_21060 [Bryobacteraceae bacterium]|nr:hypothetical protein [Bryobacteraceae bacterium]
MLRFILLLASGASAIAQQYTIATLAGGAPPATPVTGTTISIGQPRRVALDKTGNLYFSSSNSVFKLSGSGVLTLVAGNSRAGFSGDNGPAVNAQLNTPQGLAVDSAGNIYIADSANNRIRIVTPDGIINTFAGTGATSLGGGPGQYNDGNPATSGLLRIPMGVAVDSAGNVYIADTGDNSIRKVTTDGIINTIVGDSYPGFFGDGGNAVSAELHTPSDVCVDSMGNLYIADTANAVIRQVTAAGVINTFAGTTAVGFAGDGAAALKAALLAPLSVAVDASGNVYIVESGDSRVRKVDTKLNINTIVGTGTSGFGGDGSDATKAQINSPTGIAVDSSGNLYIADFLNLRVRKVSSSGSISTVAGNGVLSFSGDGGQALNAQMNVPQGVAADAAGNVYVSDTGNNVVRKVAKNGVITTIAGTGTPGNGGDGGAGPSAQLNSPMGLAVDSSGNLYIADSQNAKIRKVSTSGAISTVAGNGTPGYGGDGAAATGAQLNTPIGVAVDAAGNLFIADFSNNRIRKVSTTGTITTVAGNGNAGYSGDGGPDAAPATFAQLNTPAGVAMDGAGNLYIADAGNNRIRMVTPLGNILTIAGNGTAGYSGDGGPAINAQLANPRAIAVDSVGNVYIADGATVIRQIVYPTGIITTIGGNGTRGYSGDGALALSAQINTPSAIALDPAGNLYIADTNNNAARVLRFAGSGISVSAVVNGASNISGTISPGELVVVYGSGMGPATLTQFQLGANGLVPTSLAGTSVVVNGTPAPILYTSATQVAAMVPFGVTGTKAQVTVVYQGQAASGLSVNVAPASPGIFTANSSGTGPAAALNFRSGVTSVNNPGNPANAGDTVTLYVTGAGQTNPPGVDGRPGGDGSTGNPPSLPLLPVSAAIGGKSATVSFAGSAPGVVAGIMQVNVVVPAGLPAGAVPVTVQVGTTSAQSGVTIAVSGN